MKLFVISVFLCVLGQSNAHDFPFRHMHFRRPTPSPRHPPKPRYTCGGTTNKFKIFGGTEAEIGEYPWMAILGFHNKITGSFSWRCSATLISGTHVVTAAHCFQAKDQRLTTIRLGEHNLNSPRDCISTRAGLKCIDLPQDYRPSLILSHPDFNDVTYENDIAIIKLERPVRISAYVQPICLPPQGLDVAGLVGSYKAIVTGWGNISESERATSLQKVGLPHVNHDNCRKKLPITSHKQICFGGKLGKDSCAGDSGGPLIFPKTLNGPPFLLIGIVSYGGEYCGVKGLPGVYTNVAAYIPWIHQQMAL